MSPIEVYFNYSLAMNQKERLQKLEFSKEKPELVDSKTETIFNDLVDEISEIIVSPRKSFLRIGQDQCINLVKETYHHFFNGKYDQAIESMISKIKKVKHTEACIQYEMDYSDHIQKIHNIEVGSLESLYDVITLSHENMHGLLLCFNKIPKCTMYCYNEVLSIFFEKFAAYHLTPMQANIENLWQSFRKKSTKIAAESYKEETMFLKRKNLDEKTRLVTEYIVDSGYTYIIGDIYSERLLELYKQDPKEISTRVSHIIDREETLPKVLQDLDINITNQNTIKTYQKCLHQISKR